MCISAYILDSYLRLDFENRQKWSARTLETEELRVNTIKLGKKSWQTLKMDFTYSKIKDGEGNSVCVCRSQLEKQPKRPVRGLGGEIIFRNDMSS